jgi:hypothetical protein
MVYAVSTFSGDENHPICCTGDCVVGDLVAFERATFSGSRSRPVFAGFELVIGEIVAESYGSEKQQHTFTLLLGDGSKTRIKGRNLYANRTYRALWSDETKRSEVAQEKHQRGDIARAQRAVRIEKRHVSF